MRAALREPRTTMLGNFASLLTISVTAIGLFLLQACGGGNSLTQPLESIKISPSGSLVPLAGTRQLKATAVYSDGTKQDITNVVTWSVSSVPNPTNYVTVDATGLATGVAPGTSVISASLGPVLGVTQLTVTVSGFSTATTAVLFVPFQGVEVDAAYMPQSQTVNADGVYTVQEVNLDADQFSAVLPIPSALITSIPMPAGYVPNATAASTSSLKVAVVSYTSPNVQVIDASNDPTDLTSNTVIATFTSPISKTATFSGITCMICGVVINAANDQALLSTAQGYYTMDLNAGTFTALPLVPIAFPAESFLFNPINSASPFLLSPTFGQDPNFPGEVQILNLANNAVTTNTSLGVSAPNAAALDLFTNVGIVVDESSTNQDLLNLNELQNPSSTTWTASNTLVQITGGCNNPPAPLTMVSLGIGAGAQSQNHVLLSSQPSGDCVGFELVPNVAISGPPDPTTINYGYGPMPPVPDGNPFANGSDPNAITSYTSVFNKKSYGLLVNANQNWIARIDLAALASVSSTSLPAGQDISGFIRAGHGGDPVVYLPTTQ